MPADPKDALRASVLAAQERFDADTDSARDARRAAFAKAKEEGLTMREIGQVVGLHHTRISQIIRGE